MNRWLQTKEYTCADCKAVYLHDKGRNHACYYCPARHEPAKVSTVQDVAHCIPTSTGQ